MVRRLRQAANDIIHEEIFRPITVHKSKCLDVLFQITDDLRRPRGKREFFLRSQVNTMIMRSKNRLRKDQEAEEPDRANNQLDNVLEICAQFRPLH